MSDGSRFKVNLNAGGDTAFHFNPRFKEGCIVRNSKTGGRWAKEERHGPGLPIGPGSMFDLKIMVEPNCYKVSNVGSFGLPPAYTNRLCASLVIRRKDNKQ